MINLHSLRCPSCSLFAVRKGRMCSYCDPQSRFVIRRAESQVAAFLQENLTEYTVVRDRSHPDIFECTGKKFRPDFSIDLATHVVMVEVDEHQHSGYEAECEVSRLVSLTMSGCGKGVVMIRFNPDEFREDGVIQRVSLDTRMQELLKRVQACLSDPPSQLLTVEYLYYDEERMDKLQNLTRLALGNY